MGDHFLSVALQSLHLNEALPPNPAYMAVTWARKRANLWTCDFQTLNVSARQMLDCSFDSTPLVSFPLTPLPGVLPIRCRPQNAGRSSVQFRACSPFAGRGGKQ